MTQDVLLEVQLSGTFQDNFKKTLKPFKQQTITTLIRQFTLTERHCYFDNFPKKFSCQYPLWNFLSKDCTRKKKAERFESKTFENGPLLLTAASCILVFINNTL